MAFFSFSCRLQRVCLLLRRRRSRREADDTIFDPLSSSSPAIHFCRKGGLSLRQRFFFLSLFRSTQRSSAFLRVNAAFVDKRQKEGGREEEL